MTTVFFMLKYRIGIDLKYHKHSLMWTREDSSSIFQTLYLIVRNIVYFVTHRMFIKLKQKFYEIFCISVCDILIFSIEFYSIPLEKLC